MVLDANGLNKDGSKFACEVTVSMIDLMDPGDLVFTVRNTERRRRINTMLRAKANAFQVAQCALFACDADGNIRECNTAFCEMFDLKDEEDARTHTFAEFMSDDPLPENFKKALAGETTVTGIVAEGDEDQEEVEVVLAPNMLGNKCHGVVGSVTKV
jgi:PAS domain-containing protein